MNVIDHATSEWEMKLAPPSGLVGMLKSSTNQSVFFGIDAVLYIYYEVPAQLILQ